MLSGMVYGVMPVNDVYAYTKPIQGTETDKTTGGYDVTASDDGKTLNYNISENSSINIDPNEAIERVLAGINLNNSNIIADTIKFSGEPLDIKIDINEDSGNLDRIAGINVENSTSIDKSTGGDIYIKYNADQKTNIYGVYNRDSHSTITLGQGNIEITSTGSDELYGIYIWEGTVNKADGNITISNGSNGDDTRGVLTDGGTVNLTGKTIIHVKGNEEVDGLFASWGSINMEGGSITVEPLGDKNNNGLFSIGTSGGTVKVNESGNNSLIVNGDIFNNRGDINLNFNTIDSSLNGTIFHDSSGQHSPTVNLTFANGATWHNSIYKGYNNIYAKGEPDEIAYVNNLTMDNGKIIQGADRELTIENYSGNGELLVQGNSNNGVFENKSAAVSITKTSGDSPTLNMGIDNSKGTINTLLSKDKIKDSLNNIVNKVNFQGAEGSTLSGNVTIPEGLITPGVSAKINYGNGSGDDTKSKIETESIKWDDNGNGGGNVTSTMAGIRDIASSQIIAWRQENNSLSKRLGEIRNSTGEQGIWTRMSRGEFEYSGAYKNQYNFFQLGYDKAVGKWRLGGAVSHGRGETAYQNGSGKNRSTSLALYGTWLGDKGHYADVILKEGRLSNEYDIFVDAGHTHGDYDTWGTSLSMEYGRKNELDKGWYITPQAEMTLMKINGADYTTDNGIFVAQDDLYSAVGRAGFELGRELSDGQNAYVKASVLHEFAGDADTFVSLNGITNSYSQDIGNTWYEIGLGTNFKLSDNSYLYADVVKTFGDDIRTPWQWNVGARWDF